MIITAIEKIKLAYTEGYGGRIDLIHILEIDKTEKTLVLGIDYRDFVVSGEPVRKTIRLKSKTVKKFFDRVEEDKKNELECDIISDNGRFEGTVRYEDGTEEEVSGHGMCPDFMSDAVEIIWRHIDKFEKEIEGDVDFLIQ